MRKALFLLLIIALCLSLAAPAAAADVSYAVTGGSIYFDPSTGTITGADTSITAGDIPAEINGVAVTSIGDWAFWDCDSLTSVTIPDSVTSIGNGAFSFCNSLTSITIPNSVTSIGRDAFENCSSLTSITVDPNNSVYTSSDGVLFSKDMTELIQYPCGKSGVYAIPDGVTSIGYGAFSFCDSLTSITIPDSVTIIGDNAFYGSSLTSITIPASVTYIGESAFVYCYALTDISVSADSESFASVDGVLYSKDGTELICYPQAKTDAAYVIPDGVSVIAPSAFVWCNNLKSVTMPDSVTYIGDYAFNSCLSLTGLDIPENVNYIGRDALGSLICVSGFTVDEDNTSFCEVDGVIFTHDMSHLVAYPSGKTDAAYTVPQSVTSIDAYAYVSAQNLESVSLSDGVTEIGFFAFAACSRLESVTIPDSVTEIASAAFFSCHNLTYVYYGGSEEDWSALTALSGDSLLDATIHFGSSSDHIPGDINGDGSVNNKDLTRLFQYLSDWDVEVVEAALDVNGDGSVNNKDLTRLFQYLSDWDVEIF